MESAGALDVVVVVPIGPPGQPDLAAGRSLSGERRQHKGSDGAGRVPQPDVLAGQWFLQLRWERVDPVADQRLGPVAVAAAAVGLVALAAGPQTPNSSARPPTVKAIMAVTSGI